MPVPILANLWACNPWNREVGRETAVDMAALSIQFGNTADDIVAVPLGPDGEPVTAEEHERYLALTGDWPEVPPVIDPSLHVDRHQDEQVKIYRNKRPISEEEKAEDLECYDRADYQLDRAGYGTTDRPSRDPKNYQLLTEIRTAAGVEDVVNIEETVGAVEYMKEVLPRGRPVLVGLRLNSWDERPNDLKSTPGVIEPANHFVVMVGMGQEGGRYYFSFYDYLTKPSDHDRFFLEPDLQLRTQDGGSNLIQVRRSWKKRR